MHRFICFCLLICVLAACQRERVWVEPSSAAGEDPNNISAIDGRLVLIAPGAMDKVKTTYSDAPRGYAKQVINWLDGTVGSTSFLYAPSLPNGADAQWGQGPIAGAKGANLVVLINLLELDEIDGIKGPGGPKKNIQAKVQMRVINAQGQEVWTKTHIASVPNTNSPKFRGGPGSAPGRAIWNANKKCMNALKDWLDAKSDKDTFGKVAKTEPVQPALGKVKVIFNSTPIGADIVIDGQFKGNTPLELYLPNKEMTISIEQAAHHSW